LDSQLTTLLLLEAAVEDLTVAEAEALVVIATLPLNH
jgi:hypothetical protein